MPFLETVLHQLSAQSSLPQLALTLSVLQDLRTLLRTPEQQALFARWCVEHLAPLREQALRGELDASVQKTLLFFLLDRKLALLLLLFLLLFFVRLLHK